MDPIYDTVVVFTESFAPKPVRTFVVNTNAALHSINANVEPSSGVCTFPANSQFPDRFILWDNVQVSLCSWFFKGEGVDWLSKVAHIGRFEEADPSPEFNVFLDKILEAGLLFLSPYSAQVFLARSLALHEQYAVLMNLCTLSASSIPDELRPVMTFYSAIAYSGIGKPLKAMTNFNLAAKGVTDQNKALLTALSPVGKTQEINLGDYYVMVRCLSHISEIFNGVYQA
ncbi:unnamed protein product [Cylicocyclus nassatus]|uniref:Uncharacterized protein n=1 Tax=Cylicocyclus nassatus TaxID=53992 RepID=A0AA36DV68_CYLNA|nr:unnamed protein product [Cylicocyclus nassatus]